jgi:hypothetical protein
MARTLDSGHFHAKLEYAISLETAVNAKAQRRKGAGRKEWD